MSTQTIPQWTTSDRLVKAREWAGLTQDQLAEALGMSRRTVIRHEQADTPARWFILACAEVTGVPADWISGEDGADLRSRCFRDDDGFHPDQLQFGWAA